LHCFSSFSDTDPQQFSLFSVKLGTGREENDDKKERKTKHYPP